MADRPTVSILIPTLNEETHLGEVLEACAAQTYPADLIEVFVVDGGSSDGTREQFDLFAGRMDALSWLDNPERHQAAGLNLAASRSTGEVLVRWDAHAHYPDDYVETAVRLLEDPGVDVVGGQWIPTGTSVFEDAVAAAMGSRIGVGSGRYAAVDHRKVVDTVSCGVMTRATFEAVGGYDTALWPAGEDEDLMRRIREDGGTVVLDPSLTVSYFPRGGPRGLVRQYYGFGLAKGLILLKHRAFPSLRPLAPVLLVGGFVAGFASPWRMGAVRWIVGGYSVAIVAGSVASVHGSVGRRLRAAGVAPLMHVPYGVGVWVGLAAAATGQGAKNRDRVASGGGGSAGAE